MTGTCRSSDSRWINCGTNARRGRKSGPNETALINIMLDAMPNETVKSRITRSGLPREIRRQMGQIVGRSILAEWKPELDESPATLTQIEETTNRFLAVATTERREVMQQRLQTENGRRYVAVMAALQTNPRLKRQRQAVGWLLRGLPAPPANRQNGAPARPAALPRRKARRRIPLRRNQVSQRVSREHAGAQRHGCTVSGQQCHPSDQRFCRPSDFSGCRRSSVTSGLRSSWVNGFFAEQVEQPLPHPPSAAPSTTGGTRGQASTRPPRRRPPPRLVASPTPC